MKLVVEICIISGLFGGVFSASGENAKALRKQLFVTDGYDNRIRPVINQTIPIKVYINLFLLSINELNEVTETLKTTGYLWILWHDDYLQWDPTWYGDIKQYHWPQGDVWKPDIALKNSYLEYKELGVNSLNVFVHNTGIVEWLPFQVFRSTCAVDITYFPFDIQECKMKFVAWSYTKKEVTIMSGDKGINLDQFETNSEWRVIDTSYVIEWDTDEASIVFTLKIQRKPQYVLLSVLLPIVMLAVLNISVFVLPSESGEKSGFAITVFLSFAVFLSFLSASLPENSDTVAIFSAYLMILTIESTMITLIALILIRVSAFDHVQSPVPGKLQSFLNCVTCRRSCHGNKVKSEDTEENKATEVKLTLATRESEEDITSHDEDRHIYTWIEVANIFDKFFFVFFGLLLSMSTLIFFLIASTNNLNYF